MHAVWSLCDTKKDIMALKSVTVETMHCQHELVVYHVVRP